MNLAHQSGEFEPSPAIALAEEPAPARDGIENADGHKAMDASLWDAFARSVRNNALAEIAVQMLRVGGMIFLARALLPADFGLFKVLTIVSSIVILLSESGIPDALIQRREVSADHEATAWWFSIALSLAVAAVLYAAAPLAAHAMAMQRLKFGLRILCLPALIEGTAICANARLRRDLKFGALAAADVISEAIFIIVAITLLFNGRGAICLPAALAARLAAHGAVVWIADPRVPFGRPRIAAARDLGRFATSALGARLVTFASSNVDFILVGRLLGSGALGFYSMAWDLLRFVPDRLYRVAGRVALPTFCKLQGRDAELAHAYRNFVSYIGRLVLPIAGCVAVAAPEILASIYGPKWLPAAIPMRLLALGLAMLGLRIGIGTVYYTKDYPSFDIYVNGARLLMIVAAVTLTAHLGLIAVSASVGTIEAIVALAGQYLVCRLTGMPSLELASATLPGLRIAVVAVMATAAGKFAGIELGVQAPLILAFVAVPPALVLFAFEAREIATMVRRAFRGEVAAEVIGASRS